MRLKQRRAISGVVAMLFIIVFGLSLLTYGVVVYSSYQNYNTAVTESNQILANHAKELLVLQSAKTQNLQVTSEWGGTSLVVAVVDTTTDTVLNSCVSTPIGIPPGQQVSINMGSCGLKGQHTFLVVTQLGNAFS